MSVRKRAWTTSSGERKEAWIVDYVDQKGNRHIKTFAKKKAADAHHSTIKVDVSQGVHVADSESVTVAEAGERWIRAGEADDLQRATLDEYRRHLKMHIVPYIGNVKLSRLTRPIIDDLKTKLRAGAPAPGQESAAKRSPAMVKKIITSLGAMLAVAQDKGLVAQNVARSARKQRRKKKGDQRRKLNVGVDIPSPDEIKAIIGALEGRWRPLMLTAIFTGLRASELRGLRWSDVDLKKGELHVRQRADRYNEIDAPKSEDGERAVPLPPIVANTLREWQLVCPKRDTGQRDAAGQPIKERHFVFPNGLGNVESHANIINRALIPAQVAAGVTVKDRPKYTGLHSLRHFYASWCINPKENGGLELPAKVVQERLGHASIVMTLDTYGHLFPRGDDGKALASAERALMGLGLDATQTRHDA